MNQLRVGDLIVLMNNRTSREKKVFRAIRMAQFQLHEEL